MVSQEILNNEICAFTKGEEEGIVLLKQLIQFAPNDEIAKEILQQIIDETKHATLFNTELNNLDIDCDGLKKNLRQLYDFAQECVNEKDWTKCITIQAVIEELAMAAFTHHYKEFDAKTQAILKEIIDDETRHLQFCINQLQTLSKDQDNKNKITEVHKRAVNLMLDCAREENLSPEEQKKALAIMKKAYLAHKNRITKLDLELPPLPTTFSALF